MTINSSLFLKVMALIRKMTPDALKLKHILEDWFPCSMSSKFVIFWFPYWIIIIFQMNNLRSEEVAQIRNIPIDTLAPEPSIQLHRHDVPLWPLYLKWAWRCFTYCFLLGIKMVVIVTFICFHTLTVVLIFGWLRVIDITTFKDGLSITWFLSLTTWAFVNILECAVIKSYVQEQIEKRCGKETEPNNVRNTSPNQSNFTETTPILTSGEAEEPIGTSLNQLDLTPNPPINELLSLESSSNTTDGLNPGDLYFFV